MKARIDKRNAKIEENQALRVEERTRALNELENLRPSDAERDMIFQSVFKEAEQQEPINYSSKTGGEKQDEPATYPDWDPEDEMTLQEMREYYAGMSHNEDETNGSSEQTVNYTGENNVADGDALVGDGEGEETETGKDKTENMSIRYVKLIALLLIFLV